MVKNLPTIERSTKIRFGKQAPTNQADNTIVLNASSTAINAPTGDSIYMAPLRVTNPASTTVIGYNPTTKELYNTNVLTSDIGSGGGGGGDITLGTGTTGDYVSTITGGNGITSTGATSGETIAHTLSIDTKSNGGLVIESNKLAVDLGASSITGTLAIGDGGTGATTLTSGKIPYIKADNTFGDSKISYNNATEVTSLSSNLTVTGNLLVQGSATFQHSEIHSVSDPIIEVGNANTINTIDMGIIMTRPTANVVAGYRGDESEYTIAYTLSDPSSTDIVPTNASSDGYITANIWGNVLCGNVTTSGSLTSTAVNVDGITTSNVVLAGGYVNESTAQYFTVTAVVGAFIIDGVTQPALTLYRGITYRFDYSDNSNSSHPLRISTTAEGGQYNPGYSFFGTRGTAGAYIQFIVPMEAPDTMYYNCEVHPGMGNTINIISPSLTSSVSPVSSNVFIGNHIGIGTSSPSYPLDVTGNMNVTGGLRVNDSAGTSGQVLTSSGGGVMSWGSVGTTQGGTGVTTGLAQLDAGNITSGTLAVGRGGTGATTLDNLISLGSHTTGNYVQSITGGNGITAGAASEGGTPTVAIDAKSNGGLVIESNKLAVDLGASSITGTLAVGDGGTGATSLNNLITLGSHTTGNYVQSISGGNGITAGAASEGGTPTVAIDAKSNGGLVIESNKLAVDLGASSITGTLAVGDGGTGITSYTSGDIIYANSSSSLTKLGIGNAGDVLTLAGGNPTWAAASGGASSPWTTSGNDIVYNTGEVIIGSYISYDGPPGDVSRFGFPQNNTFTITTNNSERFRIDSNGDVGIGTTNPVYKLHVIGNGYFSSSLTASSFSGSGSGLTSLSASNISSGTLTVTRGGTGQSSYGTGEILYSSAGALTKLGIGSTGEVLTVAGGNPTWAAASGGGFSGDIADYITHTGDSDTKFGFPSLYTFTITTNNSERFRITSSGDVGIGSAATSGYKLDVSGSVRGTSFAGSGYSLTTLQAGNISSGTLAVARGGTNISSYTTGDMLYYSGSTLSKLGIGSAGQVLTVSGNTPSWAAASGGGGGGATAGTTSVSHFSNEITVDVSGGPYDYMYNVTSYNIGSTSLTLDTLNITTAMTQGQKLVLKLHTSAIGIQGKIARGSSLSVIINSTTHTVFSNFQDHTLHIPYDNNATAVKFLILEITKENTNQVTIEARLSAADFTKTREFEASWQSDGIYTNNRDSAIHNVAHNHSFAAFSGGTFRLKLGYLGVGHSHDFYFTQTEPFSSTYQASQIEFYYNNSYSPWSQASQVHVYTNFDKTVGMTLETGKDYRMHHEVLRASTDDYPNTILFTVEEMNAASGGGGGGGYATGDFNANISTSMNTPPYNFSGIDISSSFSPTNYNFNSTVYSNMPSNFEKINLDHTLPTSLPYEYHFYFKNAFGYVDKNSPNSFKVMVSGITKETFNVFPDANASQLNFQNSPSWRYELVLKARDTSGNEWTAEWFEFYKY